LKTKVHQWIPAAGFGDAITNCTFELQNLLRAEGLQSDIFAPLDCIPLHYRNTKIHPLSACIDSIAQDDLVVYHYSANSPVTSAYMQVQCRKWICYHNITPEKYFRLFSPTQADDLRASREALKTLVPMTELALGDSEFNRRELVECGFQKTDVLPLFIPSDYFSVKPNPVILKRTRDGKTNILFVGRVAPNKRIEDLIKTFYYYRFLNKNSRLILAGSSNDLYFVYLKAVVIALGLSDCVVFTGNIPLPDLIAYYRSASAFLCLSQHEGFCLPLLEAMHFNIPIFALARSAVPETLGNAGVLIHESNFKKIAGLLNEVLGRQDLLKDILCGQKQRLAYFEQSRISEKFLSCITHQTSLQKTSPFEMSFVRA
jgi:glycosyltransferase involved in cell wall biosynthesis